MSYLLSNRGAASVRGRMSHVTLASALALITPPTKLVTSVRTASSNIKSDVASSEAFPKGDTLRDTNRRRQSEQSVISK